MLSAYLHDYGPGCLVQVGRKSRQRALASANGTFPTPSFCSGHICAPPQSAVAAQDSQVESASEPEAVGRGLQAVLGDQFFPEAFPVF